MISPVAPRPGTDEAALTEAWDRPPGFLGRLAAVNHKNIGMRFIVTGFGFLLLGGLLALLMRTQLIVPESGFLSSEAYNEAFTMHGTTMMFLFAVPILEGLGMYLLPLMLGTRDLPFPRLNAFGYWCYLFGGAFVYASFLTGDVPDAGWFAYVPLAGPEYSPGKGMDFWLLGVTFVEIAGIVGGIELMISFLTRRAPGMAINRIPLFAWAVFVMAAMMVLAFPALVAASVLLEVERTFGTHFFNPAAGGDPLLWQHLFWFFGHPEVYIILLPATGVISMVVPVFSRRPIAGYSFIVAALVAIGLISFGLWVHHMFTTGIALLGLTFFAAASFLIVIPSGVQVFAWLTTMWRGRPALRTPLLFALGFVFIFLLGGITGVMVAAVPFDWQVHDSYFVVAHFHYVLIGGMLFPLFGGLYYWFPKWTGRVLAERLGQASFWTMFVGFNVAFFPQHVLGFEGMPRRVYTYRQTDGWDALNLLSSIGAYVLAIGVLITVANMVRAMRGRREAGDDPWGGGSLEWATASPPPAYNFRRIPVVGSPDPMWSLRPSEDEATRTVLDELAGPPQGLREVVETGPVDGAVRRVARLPGPSLWPLGAAVALVAALLGALTYVTVLAVVGVALAVVCLLGWAGGSPDANPAPDAPERSLPVRATGAGLLGTAFGSLSLLVVHGSLVFAYLLLGSHADRWPVSDVADPGLLLPLAATLAIAAAAATAELGRRARGRAGAAPWLCASLAGALAFAALAGAWLASLDFTATTDAYGSIVFVLVAFHLLLAAALATMLAFAIWVVRRAGAGAPTPASVDVTDLFAAVVAVTWVVTAAVVYLGPRVA